MSADEQEILGPPATRLVTAIKDYVQALNSPNGHPFSAGAELEVQVKDFAVEILRLARTPWTSPQEPIHSA